jgi:hypothetical protein
MRAALLVAVLAGCTASEEAPCTLPGTWTGSPVQGNFVGQEVTQYFLRDGSYRIELNNVPFVGNWAMQGKRLTISNDSSCQSSPPAEYDVNFYGCSSAVYAIVSDSCAGRGMTLNGMSINKLPGS